MNSTHTSDSNTNKNDPIVLERRARRFWVSVIVGLLGLQVLGGAVAVYLALSDPTVAVIPNYYQASLEWDTKRRNLEQFQSLGWKSHVLVDAEDVELQQRLVTIQMRDKDDQPVRGLKVYAQVYHHARGGEIHRLRFDEADPGNYVSITRLTKAGLWQVDLMLEGDSGTAENSLTIETQ